MAPGHLPFNLAIRIGQLARGPLGRPEDSELVVHHLLDRFTGADLTETLSRIKGTERNLHPRGLRRWILLIGLDLHRRRSSLGDI